MRFFVDVAFPGFHRFGVAVLQHLQLVFRLARQGTQRNGDGQAYHARPRYAYPHCVLQDVGAQPGFNLFGLRAQRLRGFCHAQCHGHRLCATYGRHYLSFYEVYDLFSFLFVHNGVCFEMRKSNYSCCKREISVSKMCAVGRKTPFAGYILPFLSFLLSVSGQVPAGSAGLPPCGCSCARRRANLCPDEGRPVPVCLPSGHSVGRFRKACGGKSGFAGLKSTRSLQKETVHGEKKGRHACLSELFSIFACLFVTK